MKQLSRGRLRVKKRKTKADMVLIVVENKTLSPSQKELSANLKADDGCEVEFELVKGQPTKVRPAGQPFEPPDGARQSQRRGAPEGRSRRRAEAESPSKVPVQGDFRNPYNFIPAPPRNPTDASLGDVQPVDQDRFLPERYTGVIRVRMTANTPLLLPDPEGVSENQDGHKTYPLRVDSKGLPAVPSSSVRGMLRSAYEAITNSRFYRFPHGERLAFRMEAREALSLIPARVATTNAGGTLCFELMTGTSTVGKDGRPTERGYAAWLPRYRHGKLHAGTRRYSDHALPAHGDQVECWIESRRHSRRKFQYWEVRSIARLGTKPDAGTSGDEIKRISGWVCVTNANIKGKHDERVFFFDGPKPKTAACTPRHQKQWRELIADYQAIHVDEIEKRRRKGGKPDDYLGSEPGRTAWSRHVYSKEDRELREGTLCYVRLTADLSQVESVFPVMIARELYDDSPRDLLSEHLQPAKERSQLSPADRVFGWVGEKGGAHRGLLRVGPVRCESSRDDSVQAFGKEGLPLAILSAPKPQQGRFYVAQDPSGRAQGDRLGKQEAGYSGNKSIRGRKVYPHQASLPQGHWDDPLSDRTRTAQGSPSHYQEYRRPPIRESHTDSTSEQRDDQNRSVLGWVKPGAGFTFDLHVMNLSQVELGGLIWLLSLPEGHYHRFGGGKPLGFGSVRLEIESLDLRQPDELRERYASWSQDGVERDPRESLRRAFEEAVNDASGEPESFVRTFLVACRGYDDKLPVHYPRAAETSEDNPPRPEGESFKWFVANEGSNHRYSLGDLESDVGLPTLSSAKGK